MPTKGSVLVLQFGPVPKSYVATSYPHRILDADPDDYRIIHWENMPRSLTQFLKNFQRDETKAGKPRYLMNLATFAPLGSSDWNGATAEDPPGNLWYVYYWIERADHQWNGNGTLPPGSLISLLASEFRSGSLSHVAFGPTQAPEPDCIFLRNTGADERWQYQWTGLPFLCERDCLKHVEGAAALRNLDGEADRFNGMTEWINGRLRGVTFGPYDSFIVYRGENYDWDGIFPLDLAEALRKGKDEGWSINNCVLNPRNPNEYVLAFNEADDLLRVYYALHKGFAPKFETVIGEWADGKGFSKKVKIFSKELTDAQCRHDLPPLNVPRSSSRPRNPLGASGYPSTAVSPQRLTHRTSALQENGVTNGYAPVQEPASAPFQSYQPYQHANHPNENMSSSRIAGISELQGSHLQYPQNRSRIVYSDDDFQSRPVQPVQHITNYYASPPPVDSIKKRGWRLSNPFGGDDVKSKGRKG